MSRWRLDDSAQGLRLTPVVRRALGSAEFTWADLLYGKLSAVRVFALYFPSRFDLPVDATAENTLRTFGQSTGAVTSVNFWDATDPEFSQALALFDVQTPPALVLAGGPKHKRTSDAPIDPADMYAICVTDQTVLGDPTRLAAAVNSAHEVLMRGNPKEITGYLRQQAATSLLTALGHIAGDVRDQILILRPKFLLPGGGSLQIG